MQKQLLVAAACAVGWLAAVLLPCAAAELTFPPALPGGQQAMAIETRDLLKPPENLATGVQIARTPPRVDFLYYPKQDYPGRPWSVWGDGTAVEGKYYSAIGDHRAPGGNAFVYEYDAVTKSLRCLVDVRSVLKLPDGHYTPGKIHTRVELGSDGWLYFATHRGSTRTTTDQFHYQGDWILRHHPRDDRTEIVAHGPVGKQCIPTGMLDPQRLIFYGGTAAADHRDNRVTFFAFDLQDRKLLYSTYDGPYRYLILARSTGRVYYTPSDEAPLRCYDPATGGTPRELSVTIGLRAATDETPQGMVYSVSRDGDLWAFNTKTETAEPLGSAVIGSQSYIASLDADPSGRYLYYVPGAHGGGDRDGTPIVQFDVKTKARKVVAFLHPAVQKATGYVPTGTYSLAVDPSGERLYVTWNGNRGGADNRGRYPFDTCALTVVHLPASERMP
jgi:hypothetical protein